ncbi:MAG: SAM-dependent methyltransferase [Actinobacteria bacterium HGW-Actinobacteria-7]|nr:MAG: SAM-dependent methyltransferase [Actinobacteria bacterium HGW-Actinobacteria-7]
MSREERNFDDEAASWDEQPGQVEFALELASAIRVSIDLSPDMDVLDFGCGTGLLATELLPSVRSVTAADTSAGMLDVLNRKIATRSLANIRTALIGSDAMGGDYDLILCSLTLHHVEDVEGLLGDFHRMTAAVGRLCICDIDLDGGAFHENRAGVFHDGFKRDSLSAMMEAAGFVDIEATTAMRLSRPGRDGAVRDFELFLMTGRKAS